MVKVSKARIYLKVGLGLDRWADGIIDGSRNAALAVVDCSPGVHVLERPSGKVTALMGDVHPDGNPHYWLDPRNGGVIAHNIADALAKADPAHAADYRARAEAFAKSAEESWAQEKLIADKLASKLLFTYHRSWTYFGSAFGLEILGEAEPVPGIPPTAKHLAELVAIAKARKVPVLLQEPYFSDDAGRFLSREAGVRVVAMAPSCDAPTAGSYLKHFHDVMAALATAGAGQAP
jgi:zinc/manganese transport system substrate-binding protein